ncbi:MAG: hypothetical protein R3B96_23240 [Pirellulaceae bacterium]
MLIGSRHEAAGEQPQRSLPEISGLAISRAHEMKKPSISIRSSAIATEAVKEITGAPQVFARCGTDYLTLDRAARRH